MILRVVVVGGRVPGLAAPAGTCPHKSRAPAGPAAVARHGENARGRCLGSGAWQAGAAVGLWMTAVRTPGRRALSKSGRAGVDEVGQWRLARWSDRAAARRPACPQRRPGCPALAGVNRLAAPRASDLGFDRRDRDHGRPGRGVAVRGRGAGRACLVLRPDPPAAREGAGDHRGAPRPGHLHPGLAGAAPCCCRSAAAR